MRLNVTLNEELGVRVWSFPMRYQPTDRPIGAISARNGRRYQLRSMQIILQATHGIVSGEPKFFKRAFGDTAQDYERILLMPHDFIFNREWYERFDGRPELDEYWQKPTSLMHPIAVNLSICCLPAIRVTSTSCRARRPISVCVESFRSMCPSPKRSLHEFGSDNGASPRVSPPRMRACPRMSAWRMQGLSMMRAGRPLWRSPERGQSQPKRRVAA